MLNNKDCGFNESTDTLSINGKRVKLGSSAEISRIAGDLANLESKIIYHEFETDEGITIAGTGCAILFGYDPTIDPSDDDPNFLYILGQTHNTRITGADSVAIQKTAAGWLIGTREGNPIKIWAFVPGEV